MLNNKSMLKSSFPHHYFFKGSRKSPQPRPSHWEIQVLLNVENKNSEQRDPKSTVTYFLIYDSYFQLSELLYKWDANLLWLLRTSSFKNQHNHRSFMQRERERQGRNDIQAKLIRSVFSQMYQTPRVLMQPS